MTGAALAINTLSQLLDALPSVDISAVTAGVASLKSQLVALWDELEGGDHLDLKGDFLR